MANINSNQTVYLSTTVSGGLQPYDQCARWSGGWTASNGTTGILGVGPVVPTFTPYIDSNNTPCAIPGTDGGSLTGTLMPNGFTGSISVWVDVADSSGIFKESNTKSYTVLPVTALVVNAGPDGTISGVGPHSYTVTGATASGGTPPYTWAWSQDFPGDNPEISYFTTSTSQNPDIDGFSSNGIYYFQLTATDSLGQTGTDEMQITVTGAAPPPTPIPSAAISWSILRDLGALGEFRIDRRRSGVITNLVLTSVSTLGTIPVGVSGLVAGDQIRITTSCADGSGGFSSNANILLDRQLRNPPNTANNVQSVIDSDLTGSPVFVYIPSQFGWYTVDPTAYWYNINAGANLY